MSESIKVTSVSKAGAKSAHTFQLEAFLPNITQALLLTENFYLSTFPKFHPEIAKDLSAWSFYDILNKKISFQAIAFSKIVDQLLKLDPTELTLQDPPELFKRAVEIAARNKSIRVSTLYSPNHRKAKLKATIKEFLLNLFLSLYSLLSALLFILSRKEKVAIWTGDYLDANKGSDPRLGDLYPKIREQHICYIEFIRHTSVTTKTVLKNLIQRKRPVIYYQAILDLLASLTKFQMAKPQYQADANLTLPQELALIAFKEYYPSLKTGSALVSPASRLFKLMNISSFLMWFYSSRTFVLFHAAKKAKIKTIGFMHGMSVKTLMRHEYMPEYLGAPIGFDRFGVWTDYWKSEFLNFSKLYDESTVVVSGPIRSTLSAKSETLQSVASDKIQVLFISEASTPPEEFVDYYNEILSNDKFELSLKIRSFGRDLHYEALQARYPELLSQMKIVKTSVPDAFKGMNFVLGSHSTVILEASQYEVPFIFLHTKIWEDYYSLSSSPQFSEFYLKQDESVCEKMLKMSQSNTDFNYKLLANNFIGDKAGLNWLLKEIQS